MKAFAIEQSYYFKAAPKRVFNALTDSKILTKWFLSGAELIPKKGGSYSFNWIGGYEMTGKVKLFEPNKIVSYSWHDKVRGKMVDTVASFRVDKKGNGALLRLRHSGFREPEHFADCSSRWGYYLTNMKSVLDHGVDLRSKYDW